MGARRRATTPVTLGWVVVKRFTKDETVMEDGTRRVAPKHHTKTISKTFLSHEAATVFKMSAEKYAIKVDGEYNVEFYVTAQGGADDIPQIGGIT